MTSIHIFWCEKTFYKMAVPWISSPQYYLFSVKSVNQLYFAHKKLNVISLNFKHYIFFLPFLSSKTSTSKSSKEVGPKKGSTSPKLPSYRGMADNCRFEGETVRHFNAGKLAVFEMRAPNCRKDEIQVNIISKYY